MLNYQATIGPQHFAAPGSSKLNQGVRTKYQIPETWDGRQPLIYPGSRENATPATPATPATSTSPVEKPKVAPPAVEKPKVDEAAEYR